MKQLLAILLIVTLAAPVIAAGDEHALPYDALIRSAKIYLGQKQKDYESAKMRLREAVDNYENPIEAYYLLGLIHSEKAEYKEMIQVFSKFKEICTWAEENNDKNLKKRCQKDEMPQLIEDVIVEEWEKAFQDGLERLRYGDSLTTEVKHVTDDSAKASMERSIDKLFNSAKEEFEVCVMLDSTRYQAMSNLAIVENRLSNPEKAVELYERSLAMKPSDVEVISGLANTLFKLDRLEEAAGYFEEMAVEDTLNAVYAYTYALICYQKLQQRDKMKELLDKALEAAPNDDQLRLQRGLWYIQEAASQSLRDSLTTIDSMLTKRPNDKALKAAKQELTDYRIGFYDKALPDFKVASEIDPTLPEYRYWHATAALFADDVELAQKIYEECVQLDPSYTDCWCGLETVYARMKMQEKFEEAQAKCGDE